MTTAPPKIFSVDDHVIEPPDLWQRRLPAKFRDAGPKIVRLPWERKPMPNFRSSLTPGGSGPEADCWMVEDIPQFTLSSAASIGLRPDQLDGSPIDYVDMRPGCYE